MSRGRTAGVAASELRQSFRRLLRSPGFATLAVGMLAVGIGINGGMLALMDALFFRPPLHVGDPAAVYRLHFTVADRGELEQADRTHYPNVEELETSGAFEAVAGYRTSTVSVGRGAETILASGMLVSPRFFDVLRPTPQLGQLSLAGDGVVISYGFWRRHFAADPRVPGRALTLDGHVYTVAGVAPAGFYALSGRAIDVWVPLDHGVLTGIATSTWRTNRDRAWLYLIARLRKDRSVGVATDQAGAVLLNRGIALKDEERVTAVRTMSVVPGRDGRRTLEGRIAVWLGGVSALVLLMACANVANLVGARMFAQRRDGYIRLTLGASPEDLMWRSLLETSLIVVPAATGAVVLSFVLRNLVSGYLSLELPLPRTLFDARTLAFTVASAGIAFAMIAAVALWELRSTVFRQGGLLAGTAMAMRARKSRRLLLALQACLCLVLLFVAGLFATSLQRAQAVDLGIDIDRTIQVTLGAGPGTGDRGAIFADAHAALAGHPDVEAVAVAESSPFQSGFGVSPRAAERSSERSDHDGPIAYGSRVGPGFFAAVGAPSLRGRDFTSADRAGAPAVAIINAPLAARLWPNRDALGQCMRLEDDSGTCVRVVGVTEGFWKMNVLERDRMAVYLPLGQVPGTIPGILFVRTRVAPDLATARIRAVVQTLRPDLPAANIVLMRDVVAPQFRPLRLGASVFSAFAAVALFIAMIGLYGVVAAATALRVKEIGVRIALGARRGHLVRTVAGEGVPAVVAGFAVGAALLWIASRWFDGVLFETSPGDPAVILQTAAALLAVALLALMMPVLRALRTSPAEVLRSQ